MWKKFVSWIKAAMAKVSAFFQFIVHQIHSLITDKDWDLDPQKLIGFIVALSGATIFVIVVIRYAVAGPIDSVAAGIGLGAIATGGTLLGWRNHTDVTGTGA